jgi:Raf kinase inhibitor-like YbhB/YbcL family protein
MMQLTSPDFNHTGLMPLRFTMEGERLSPALAFTGLPAGVRSLVLFMIDVDVPAPMGPFTHWCIYDLPASTTGLPEGVTAEQIHGLGGCLARNGANQRGYYPPCPVKGAHAYTFELFALSVDRLQIRDDRWSSIQTALVPFSLASARLTGMYRCAKWSDRRAMLQNLLFMAGFRH